MADLSRLIVQVKHRKETPERTLMDLRLKNCLAGSITGKTSRSLDFSVGAVDLTAQGSGLDSQ
jgi:hypothetical protein